MAKREGRPRGLARRYPIDRREVEEEIRRNRESNERFTREYSAWFEARASKSKKARKGP